MAKPTPLSGFPEWLPAQRIAEQQVLDRLRRTFELWGFASVETRAVEPLEQMLRKGEIDKEVYVLRRLHADPGSGRLRFGAALRPDRAVRALRPGERRTPALPLQALPDPALLAWRAAAGGALSRVHPGRRRRRRRRVAGVPPRRRGRGRDGRGAGVPGPSAADDAGQQPQADRGLLSRGRRSRHRSRHAGRGQAGQGTACGGARAPRRGRADGRAGGPVPGVGVDLVDGPLVRRRRTRPRVSPTTCWTWGSPSSLPSSKGRPASGDRRCRSWPTYGSLGASTTTPAPSMRRGWPGSSRSGRSARAAATTRWPTDGARVFPGVGISFGVTRALAPLFTRGLISASRPSPSCVLVAVVAETSRAASDAVARSLRSRGIPCEVAPAADKFGKQIRYAERRGIPYVWFPGVDPEGPASGRRGQGHPLRRPGPRRPRDLDPARARPPPDRHPPLTLGFPGYPTSGRLYAHARRVTRGCA